MIYATKIEQLDVDLFIVLGKHKDLCKFAKHEFEKPKGRTACVVSNGNQWYLWMKKWDINAIAHECVHISFEVGKAMGKKMDYDNQEFLAQYTGELVEEILEAYIMRADLD